MTRRVVVTGIGVVTPIGIGKENFWQSALAGKSGIDRVHAFNPDGHASQIAGEVLNFDPNEWISVKAQKRMARFSQFAVAAAKMALSDSGLELGKLDAFRVGVSLGVAAGDYEDSTFSAVNYRDRGPGHSRPFAIPKAIVNMAASAVALELGITGVNIDVTTACASGSHALGLALDLIRSGRADVIFSGGAEATINPVVMDGYDAMKALSRRNSEPTKASRPFDRDRDGFVIGEGSGILLLEEFESARKRGARIYAEFAGFGATCDAYHIVAPHPEGAGAKNAILAAIRDSGAKINEVDYINAHGTSTPANDTAETLAIKGALNEHAHSVMISSLKSMTGHTFGAAGGIEATATVLSITTGKIHPTINLDNPDPQCDLDYVPNTAREKKVRFALSNSFGFGGQNAVLAFRAV